MRLFSISKALELCLENKTYLAVSSTYLHELFHYIHYFLYGCKRKEKFNFSDLLDYLKEEAICFSSSFYKNVCFEKEYRNVKKRYENTLNFWKKGIVNYSVKMKDKIFYLSLKKDIYDIAAYLGMIISKKFSKDKNINNLEDIMSLYFCSFYEVEKYMEKLIGSLPSNYLEKNRI